MWQRPGREPWWAPTQPPIPGDGQDYDNIALQILRGRGVAVDFRDEEWRRPYERSNDDGRYDRAAHGDLLDGRFIAARHVADPLHDRRPDRGPGVGVALGFLPGRGE